MEASTTTPIYTPKEKSAAYVEAHAIADMARTKLQDKVRKLEKSLEGAKARLDKLPYAVAWDDALVLPIMHALEARFPAYTFNMCGPFGIGARVFISAYKDAEREQVAGSLAFEPRDLDAGRIEIVDYSKKVHDYPPNSIGELNGLGYGTVPLPESFEDLVTLFERSE